MTSVRPDARFGWLVALSALIVAASAWPAPAESRAAEPAAEGGISRVFVTGETRGTLEPCGCEKGQFGGLARRTTYLKRERQTADVLVDLGNLAESTDDAGRVGWRCLARALDDLGYDALVPGGSELALLPELRAESARFEHTKVVCANLLDAATGRPVFDPWLVRELPDRTRLALVGLTSEDQAAPAGCRIAPVLATAREALTALRGRADRVIFVGWIEGRVAETLADDVRDAVAVVGSKVPRGSPELLRRGGAPIVLASERAQYVAVIELDGGARAVRSSLAWLGPEIAPDPDAARRVAQWRDDVRLASAPQIREIAGALRSEGRLGSASCKECHARAYEAWSSSAHAHAMRTLVAKRQDRNPTCVRCHLQDVKPAADGGAADFDGGVGCETCHPGAGRHASPARRSDAGARNAAAPPSSAPACTRCHDEEHSRGFDLATYLRRIEHAPSRTDHER